MRALLIILSLVVSTVAAHSAEVEIPVLTSKTPSSALGIVFGPGIVTRKRDVAVRSVRPGLVVVTVKLDPDDIQPQRFASALVLTDDNGVHFGEVRALDATPLTSTLATLPACGPERASFIDVPGRGNLLESLVRVREQRRSKLRSELGSLLDESSLESLRRLERGFGLGGEEPLSANLPVVVLNDRLARIREALRAFQANVAQQKQR